MQWTKLGNNLMFFRLLLLFGCLTMLGCDNDNGEINRLLTCPESHLLWRDPVDVGSHYPVRGVNVGDTVLLQSGEYRKIESSDDIHTSIDGITSIAFIEESVDENGNPVTLVRSSNVVPEGPPIVSIYVDGQPAYDIIKGKTYLNYSIGIDRVLDYPLFVYVEHQVSAPPEYGPPVPGEASRYRLLHVIPKGEVTSPLLNGAGHPDDYTKISVRILPHTEMDRIALPTEVAVKNPSDLPIEDRVVLEGYTLQPYRISSPSYVVGGFE